jgi:hypothetical protein
MNKAVDLGGILAAHLVDPTTSWSLGTFGAIAEFMRDAEEPVTLAADGLAATTARGAIRIQPPAGLRLFASESATSQSWNHRVALCLAADRCAMSRRTALTEIGPDADAIREGDRTAVLFDLGLDVVQADICVRIADPAVVDRLRNLCGRPVFEAGNTAMGVLLAANPHRVFISRVGRLEVFQPIPPPDGTSPDGPHTHVLPKLLRARRTHAATEPIPEGWVPCAHFYPAHPVKDAYGVARPYDPSRDVAFRDLMQAFGDTELVALKARIAGAIAAGDEPTGFAVPDDRFARATMRVVLRQLLTANGPSAVIAAWQRAHDRVRDDEPADAEPGH